MDIDKFSVFFSDVGNVRGYVNLFSDSVEMRTNGEILGGRVSEDTLFKVRGEDVEIKRGCYVRFNSMGFFDVGEVCYSVRGEEISFRYIPDHRCVVEFYKDGSVAWGLLFRDTYIDIGGKKVIFKGDISFHESGVVERGRLFEETLLLVGDSEVKFSGDCDISFHENGSVEGGYLYSYCYLNCGDRDVEFKGDCRVHFHADGSVERGVLYEDTVFRVGDKEVEFAMGSFVRFHANGVIASGYVAKDTVFVIEGHGGLKDGGVYSGDELAGVCFYRGGEEVEFYESGDLKV